LIDTGFSNRRTILENKLKDSGCQAGNLKLIILTHGDPDHAGNAAYLSKHFGAKIAMHNGDLATVELSDIMSHRKAGFLVRLIVKTLFFTPFYLKKSDRFKPDLNIEEGWDLNRYGIEAKAIHIPGHSRSSIGIMTTDGDLYCGDLFMNGKIPRFSSAYVDLPVANSSVEKLKRLNIKTVYPGHGKPFPFEEFLINYRG
jgi:hydroxyacylglutathione hydrolase